VVTGFEVEISEEELQSTSLKFHHIFNFEVRYMIEECSSLEEMKRLKAAFEIFLVLNSQLSHR
jgi:hypothetical protein